MPPWGVFPFLERQSAPIERRSSVVADDTPKFILVVVVVADLEESVHVRLRDDDSMTDALVDQKDRVSGRDGIPVDPAPEL